MGLDFSHTDAHWAYSGFHDLVRDFQGERPRIVCLCGSTRFREAFAYANRELTKQGFIVLAPGVFGHSGDPFTDEDKQRFDELHKRKIDLADEIFVVNPSTAGWPGGYFGDSTRREIEYATAQGKPIRYLTNPNPDVSRGACRCGHGEGDHEAGECWAHFNGDQCSCSWYEPAEGSR